MISITKAEYLGDYRLHLVFNTQEEGVLDMGPFLAQEKRIPFQKLRDKKFFQHFSTSYTLSWGENLDFAPEFFYFKTFENKKEYQKKFQEWGYIPFPS